MKNKVIFTTLAMTGLVLSSTSVSAMFTAPTMHTMPANPIESEAQPVNNVKTITPAPIEQKVKNPIKNNETINNVKKTKDYSQANIIEKQEQANKIAETFKKENAKKVEAIKNSLTSETKAKIENINSEFQSKKEELINKFKNPNLTLEEKDAIKAEIKELYINHKTELSNLTAGNKNVQDAINSKTEMQSKMQEKQNKMKANINKYKDAFAKRLGDKFSKISTEKLDKIIVKIDTLTEKFENKKISQEKKDKILSQLTALKILIQEEIENRNSNIDIENLIK